MARGAKRARALVACAAGALAISTAQLAPATAQTRTAEVAERERRAEEARAQRMRAQAEAAAAEVRDLDARLLASARRRAEAEAAAAAAEARLQGLRLQIEGDTTRQAQARQALEAALIAAALAERRVEPRVVRVGIFARAAAPGFSRADRDRAAAIADARQLEQAIAEEQELLEQAKAAIETERVELARLLERRRALQARYTADAATAERRARRLAAEARDLRDLARRAAATARNPGAGPSVIPAAWRPPADGRMVRAFGARAGEAAPSQGVVLRTRPGAQVTAPAAGEVSYAGPFRSYGQVLILNLDGGYALVLTGLGAITARVGDTVRTGQPVGEMPASDTSAPDLYVEVRRNGQPIDPGRWLSGSAAQPIASAR